MLIRYCVENYPLSMKNDNIKFLAFIIAFLFYTNALAMDIEREKRIEEQTLEALFTGEPFYLSIGESEFLTLETENTGDRKGAVILLHGRGLGADSETVVGPLREALADDGWHTLSLQMPVLEKGAKYYDYVEIFDAAHPRIEASISHLQGKGISPIVLLAHSCGVHMSMDWIRHNEFSAINAYVGLGMGATDYKQPMREPFPFEKMNIPILDVYGSEDYPAVVTKADQRLQAFQNSHDLSAQVTVEQADHEFTDQNDSLIETVTQWLDKLPGKGNSY